MQITRERNGYFIETKQVISRYALINNIFRANDIFRWTALLMKIMGNPSDFFAICPKITAIKYFPCNLSLAASHLIKNWSGSLAWKSSLILTRVIEFAEIYDGTLPLNPAKFSKRNFRNGTLDRRFSKNSSNATSNLQTQWRANTSLLNTHSFFVRTAQIPYSSSAQLRLFQESSE